METWKAELLYKSDLVLGEGAHWHPAWQRFLFVDIESGEVGAIDPGTRDVIIRRLGKRVGTVVPVVDGSLVVALQGGIYALDDATGLLTKLVGVEEESRDNRCNDGKCDAAGRLWVGTMHVEALPNAGALYRYDGHLHKMLDNTTISNGICWTADNRTMYYIDSYLYTITAYDFDLESGGISNPRVVVRVDAPFMPDGMCIDRRGMLWVAIWGGACVCCYDPRDGRLLGKVMVDAPHVTSCAFGGKDMRQLFITTARKEMTGEQRLQYPDSGSLFIVDLPYEGVAPNCFTPFEFD